MQLACKKIDKCRAVRQKVRIFCIIIFMKTGKHLCIYDRKPDKPARPKDMSRIFSVQKNPLILWLFYVYKE